MDERLKLAKNLLESKGYTVTKKLDESKSMTESINSISQLKGKISTAVEHYLIDEGFEEDEVDEYFAIDFKSVEDGYLRVEVRAEVYYDGLMDLCDILNPIVQGIDKDSYFEPETSGIISAYLLAKGLRSK